MTINLENIKNNRIIRHIYYFANGIVHKGSLRKKAEKTIDAFGAQFQSQEDRENTIKDMLRMNSKYGFGFDEYLYFHFAKKTLEERLSFVADWEHLGYTCTMNNPKNAELFDNKWKTYQTFRPYYRRDVQLCNGLEDEQVFNQFLRDHKRIVIKPLDDSCGHGVRIIDTVLDGLSQILDCNYSHVITARS